MTTTVCTAADDPTRTTGDAPSNVIPPAHTRRMSLLRNGTFITLTTLVTGLLGYPFWAVATQRLGPTELGYATASVALFSLVAQLADLGLSTTVVQRVAQLSNPADRLQFVRQVIGLVVLAAGLATIGAYAIASLILPGLVERLGAAGFALGAAYAAVTVAGRVVDSLSIATRRAHGMFVRNLVTSLTKLVLFVLVATSAVQLLLVWVIAAVAATAAQAQRLGLLRAPATERGTAELVASLRTSASHYLGNLGGEVPMFLLPLLVLGLGGPDVAGSYYIVAMFSIGLFMVSAAVSASMFAEASAAPDHIHELTRHALRVVVPIAALGVAVTSISAGTILSFFDLGTQRDPALLLVVFAVSAIPDGITNVYLAAWRARGRAFESAVVNTVMGAAALAVTAAMFSSFGIVAVGIGWCASQTAGCIYIAGSTAVRGR